MVFFSSATAQQILKNQVLIMSAITDLAATFTAEIADINAKLDTLATAIANSNSAAAAQATADAAAMGPVATALTGVQTKIDTLAASIPTPPAA